MYLAAGPENQDGSVRPTASWLMLTLYTAVGAQLTLLPRTWVTHTLCGWICPDEAPGGSRWLTGATIWVNPCRGAGPAFGWWATVMG